MISVMDVSAGMLEIIVAGSFASRRGDSRIIVACGFSEAATGGLDGGGVEFSGCFFSGIEGANAWEMEPPSASR